MAILLAILIIGTVLALYVRLEKRINLRSCPECGFRVSIDGLDEDCPKCGSLIPQVANGDAP
jgi:hypothetical protein